jgi:polysaccharide pyruvyl transferase WcaK-like protein
MKKICVLGNFSGRNMGDAAILGGLLEDVSALYPETLFIVPTIKPSFVKRAYSRYNVRPVSLMPWNLSLKILGVPVFTSTLRSDIILVTDAILFDRRLYDPTHNYLLTLSYALPLAHRRGIPIILYNMSLGPVKTRRGTDCLRRVLSCCDLIITRDAESQDLARRLGVEEERLRLGADCALNVVPSGNERLSQIMRRECFWTDEKPIVGFNINSYLDTDVRAGGKGIDRDYVLRVMSAVIDRTISTYDVNVLLIITQPMDIAISMQLMSRVTHSERIKSISNREYSHGDFAKVLSRCAIVTAMRTHCLILASAMGTPVAGIVSYPKNRGYLRSIDMGDQLLEFDAFTEENLWRLVERTWRDREELRRRLRPAIEREKAKARKSADLLRPYITRVS